ncbi:MAG: ABC transporter permease [Armatimonadota bacterium]|nr:ABC transporter permease [Armatimonadota bacterium]
MRQPNPKDAPDVRFQRGSPGLAGLAGRMFAIREINILLVVVALSAYIYHRNNDFGSPYNVRTVLEYFSVYALLAIGETLVILTAGIDLSVGSLVGLTGFLAAYWMARGLPGMSHGAPMGVAIGAALLLALAIGYVHGFFVTKLGVAPFIITLGTLIIARGAASLPTRGEHISNLPDAFSSIAWSHLGPIPVPAIILFCFAVAAVLITQYTSLGREIYAIGGNMEAARLAGINVDRRRMFCYMSSAFLAGVAGVLVASKLSSGDPTVAAGYELPAIAAVVIGGTSLMGGEGTILGTLLGGALMSILANGLILLDVNTYWHEICMGGVVVIAVTLDSLRRKKRRPAKAAVR